MPQFDKVTVTGATGHLGNVLVRELVQRGKQVRVLILPNEDPRALAGLPVEYVTGDVTRPATLAAAFEGADAVFHLAGIVCITSGQRTALERVNVEGTRNVLAACHAAGVRRVAVTASVHALTEPPPGRILDETASYDPALAEGDYGKSKAAAALVALEAARAGLDVVLVLPSGVIGPFDYRLSEVGQMIRMFAEGHVPPVMLAGGYDFVDVRDVGRGHILALEHGRTGESYILSGNRLTVKSVMQILACAAGRTPPRLTLPLWVAASVAWAPVLWERISGRRALFTPYAIHTLGVRYEISYRKAQEELGFSPMPAETSLRDAWKWMNEDPDSPFLRAARLPRPGRVIAEAEPEVS
jgi:dihydroflavonol-4-reductase